MDDHPVLALVSTETERAEAPAVVDLAEVRSALVARLDDCWDRLEDVVSELVALHEVPAEEIAGRVQHAIELERV